MTHPLTAWTARVCLSACAAALLSSAAAVSAQPLKVGEGTIFLAPKGRDKGLPAAPGRTEAMLKQAAPTSQWYSTLLFNPAPQPIYVQPMTIKATPAGLEWVLPRKEVTATERKDTEVAYPHRAALLLSPVGFEPGAPKLAKVGDWSIDISFAKGADDMRVTVAHGSPYAFVKLSRGDLRLTLPGAASAHAVSGDGRVLFLQVDGQAYALFGPSGTRWSAQSATQWTAQLPAGKHQISAAVMPDAKPETLALFTRHAYAVVQDTRAHWRYDADKSRVVTEFKVSTEVLEGPDNGTLMGLYPHQWHQNASVADRLGPAFTTVRGPIKLLAGNSFSTTATYSGFVPYWPAIGEHPRKGEMADLMKVDVRNARRLMLPEGQSGYWQGKGLQRITKLMDVAEQQGDSAAAEQLLAMVKKRMEEWFAGGDNKRYFFMDKSLGTVASYPDDFNAIAEINDHHFWWGYWIRAAAEVGLRDPSWIAKDKWGGMVELLIADIATVERGRADFPFLRNFDIYEGHSWANGLGGVGEYGEFGNNQESSSEAINAWAGLILWGEITGNTALRDLGIALFTTEVQAINHYWFDVHGLVLSPEYKNVDVAQLFGGKYIHNTWWTDDPRQITGINLLPLTTASTYFGEFPAYVRRNMQALKAEQEIWAGRGKKVEPADIWQDVFAKYLSLADPEAGLAQWNRWGAVELGETRTHTLHWLMSLQTMGAPDLSVTANTPLYSVFKHTDGRKTYLAYNVGSAPLNVRFSDGQTLTVPPKSLAQQRP